MLGETLAMSSHAGVGRTSPRYDSAGAATGPRDDSSGGPAAPDSAAENTAAAQNAASPASSPGTLWRWRPSWVAVAALLTGLIVTGALSLTSAAVYSRNERRLLNLRVRELSLVLAATAPSTQTPLASAAELANATDGDAQKFRAFMAPYVGPGRQFTSVSLWPLGAAHLAPSTVLGKTPALASMPERAEEFFAHSTRPGVLNLTGFLNSPHPALGFDFSASGRAHGFAVYAENPLPANRRSKLEKNSAFSDLNYALYLGHSKRTSDVLVTSLKHLPIKGRQASDVVPFGAGVFTIVVSPNGSLGGSFFEHLPWIIALVGLLGEPGGRADDRSAGASPTLRRAARRRPRPGRRREPGDVHRAAQHRADAPARAVA